MNKKSSIGVVDIFRLLFVIVAFFSFVFLSNAFIVTKVDIFDVESSLLEYRLLFSDKINYVDSQTGRLYSGVINLQKFTSGDLDSQLMNSIYYGKINSQASAKLVLSDTKNQKEYESYYNKELYLEKKVLVEAKLIGEGSARRLQEEFYVLIKDNDDLRQGVLKIEAIIPN